MIIKYNLNRRTVNLSLESDFSNLVSVSDVRGQKRIFIVLPCRGEMDFAGAPLGNFVRIYPAIKWVIEIVDIYVRISTIQMKGVEFRKHKPVSKGH